MPQPLQKPSQQAKLPQKQQQQQQQQQQPKHSSSASTSTSTPSIPDISAISSLIERQRKQTIGEADMDQSVFNGVAVGADGTPGYHGHKRELGHSIRSRS
ncbi:uncharacterized protein Dana_GF27298 [Drosophila ananassae]|uniref:Uncharacterized protein n=1 Tax=Drosophila ananassae TaxID=7217 RepID=A0A0P8ZKP4_DROAN|nr:uncharacterized protein Dana_GF27298 [Drosophila ananassae]